MKIKVGIIGCGAITEHRHAPEYAANDNVEIVAFCDPILKRAEKLTEQFSGKAYSSYEEVLSLKELDAVSVCSSNSTHAQITIAALKAGKHVLCEKPMATTLEEASEMIEASKKYNRFLMIDHNQRLLKAHIQAKRILDSGELGRILTFKATFGHLGPEMWSADKGKNTWFFRKNTAAIGASGDLGIHKIDLIRWLLGEEIDEVFAVFSTKDKKYDDNTLIDVEDNAIFILNSRSGITGNINASWTYYGQEDNSTILYCSKGIVKIFSDPEYQVILEMKDGERIYHKTEKIQTNSSQSNTKVIDTFINCILNATKPEISGEEGFEALSIIMSSLESAKKKTFIKVKHIDNK